jgi:hypothetical protein
LRINGRVEVRGVGVYKEVGRFSCGTRVPWSLEPEVVGVPHRVALRESMGGKRA